MASGREPDRASGREPDSALRWKPGVVSEWESAWWHRRPQRGSALIAHQLVSRSAGALGPETDEVSRQGPSGACVLEADQAVEQKPAVALEWESAWWYRLPQRGSALIALAFAVRPTSLPLTLSLALVLGVSTERGGDTTTTATAPERSREAGATSLEHTLPARSLRTPKGADDGPLSRADTHRYLRLRARLACAYAYGCLLQSCSPPPLPPTPSYTAAQCSPPSALRDSTCSSPPELPLTTAPTPTTGTSSPPCPPLSPPTCLSSSSEYVRQAPRSGDCLWHPHSSSSSSPLALTRSSVSSYPSFPSPSLSAVVASPPTRRTGARARWRSWPS